MRFTQQIVLLLTLTGMLLPGSARAQQRWFDVEVSVFSNESRADREAEVWQADRLTLQYPARLRRLDSLLDFLLIDSLMPSATETAAIDDSEALTSSEPDPAVERADLLRRTGPFPASVASPFRLPDFDRDAYLELPESASDFRQTNVALRRDPGHRLLFHGHWRQPMPEAGRATAILLTGGDVYGGLPELQGSLALSYNEARDRIVADTNLWLAEFSSRPDTTENWVLPPLPEVALQAAPNSEADRLFPVRIYQLRQAREMRSSEFHYLDHPALGLVISLQPYERPPPLPSVPTPEALEPAQ